MPIITFDYGDINIDLMFAQLPVDSVPPAAATSGTRCQGARCSLT